MTKDKFMKILFLLAALMSVLSIIVISVFLIKSGLPIFIKYETKDFLLGKNWAPTDIPASYGILPMILGSIYITIGAIIIAAPIGILTAIFLVFYCPEEYYKYFKPAINLMAGIPSIIYGFFGLVVLVPLSRSIFGASGNSIVTASLLLGIMILPTIINLSETSIRSVPKYYFQGALALGARTERAIFSVVVPASKSGIISSIILGISRAIGETMAVVMVAGNQARMPRSIFKGVRTLTTNIVIEMGYASGVHREALIGTALVLFIFILTLNLIFAIIKRRSNDG